MAGLGKIHGTIHDLFFRQLENGWPDMLPQGNLTMTEGWVRATEIDGIQLYGRVDGLVSLVNGESLVLDLKTTSRPEYAIQNYAFQLNVYAFCLENAEEGFPFSTVDALGVVTYTPYRFGISAESGGVVGQLSYHDVPKDYSQVFKAIDIASELLESDTPPTANSHCEWCAFYAESLPLLHGLLQRFN